ncbi:related to DNA polymerase alpha catalytic subunit A [Saccharomycodes ludwigii]|uniref:DNA polymerase n=1 Tax=Saccharomycodes ludwigii TaxID=36035 RepID=A0A376B2S2_9ASCO|nr:related to DNA polymerase alpha catalytic subunit A [Saccharomycodes ludwigii]
MSTANKLKILKKLKKTRNNTTNRRIITGSDTTKDKKFGISEDDKEEEEEEEKIYDLIDENEYRTRKRQELLKDDFVVDDDGIGEYVDNGVDDWEHEHNYYTSDEDQDEDLAMNGKIKKSNKAKNTSNISSLITKHHSKSKNKGSSLNTLTSATNIGNNNKRKINADDFDDILADFDDSLPSITNINTRTHKGPSSTIMRNSKKNNNLNSSGQFTDNHLDSISDSANAPLIKNRRVNNNSNNTDMNVLSSSTSIKKIKLSSPTFTTIGSSPLRNVTTNNHLNNNINGDADMDLNNEFISNISSSPFKKTTTIQDDTKVLKKEDLNKHILYGVGSNGIYNGDDDDDNDDDDDDVQIGSRRTRRVIRTAATNRKINLNMKSESITVSPFVTAPNTPNTTLHDTATLSSPLVTTKILNRMENSLTTSEKLTKEQLYVNDAGDLEFFWLDYSEVDGTLLLFGKIKTLEENKFESCMLQVDGLYKELYFLPKATRTVTDIHEEIIPLLMDMYGLENIRAKPEKMKYAFELPDIPRSETEYLKVLLPYKTPKNSHRNIPSDLTSENIAHVFGGSTKIFESFVVQRKIMGPCWLTLSGVVFDQLRGASHCRIELKVNKPNDVQCNTGITTNDVTPPLKTMALNVQTSMNTNENRQEIVSITMNIKSNVNLDNPGDDNKATVENNIITLVRPPQSSTFPVGLSTLLKKKFPTNTFRLFNNEKTLLNCFAALMKVHDPDIIVGHRLENVALDIILSRMYDFKIVNFSTMGRRLRREWPEKFKKHNNNNNFYIIRDIFSGRLICDIANEMGQSLTPKCQSWDLAEMYSVTCGKEYSVLEINFNKGQYQEDSNAMSLALEEGMNYSSMIDEIATQIQILSLTKQLTNLAGNSWNQTLSGNRAARNEYILLHEFTREHYIVPDKELKRSNTTTTVNSVNSKDNNTVGSNGRSKKSKYQGGLVFEPERGLHRNYVLVMDFNSLYPSIIQEFNICFTTVDRDHLLNASNSNDDEFALPEIPSSDKSQGVLPRLLHTLVQRRYEVKKIMKTETDPYKKQQCEIKQQALKLTANSMYGCLGYVHSRFYAKPLAMLVTNKGREILMNTRQLAESLSLTVVYGDTDSVMIDTGCTTYKEAIKIGESFKKLVNERYKLLEIDIDNVFSKLLLHAKKKYAALTCYFDEQGNEKTLLEVKGLDMKRREYCPLSKEVSAQVLKLIFSDKFNDPEMALQEVYSYLEVTAKDVNENKIKYDQFRINTRLSKDPSQYPGGKSMPAVQVALRLRKAGRVIKAGSVITFIITQATAAENEENTFNGNNNVDVANRARAFVELLAKGSTLQPDPDYYLEKQIFTPVKRLLENIEGFDVVRLGISLGLGNKRHLLKVSSGNANNNSNVGSDLQPLESTISDRERFKDCRELVLLCPHCEHCFAYGGLISSPDYEITFNGIRCKYCEHTLSAIEITSQVESRIRGYIALYYEGWLQCNDTVCNNITRSVCMYGKKCLVENCSGVMHYKYSDRELYNQLLYFDSLFDVDKNKMQKLRAQSDKSSRLNDGEVRALAEQNRGLLNVSRGVVQKYLNDCARRYVNMSELFGFM